MEMVTVGNLSNDPHKNTPYRSYQNYRKLFVPLTIGLDFMSSSMDFQNEWIAIVTRLTQHMN